ncbi:MAG: efflux RND transporter permease subunit [Verrucomicrobiae bacterium]|nr:efflux RND transporter permease subunit [Verrucomicrobiae bacterium]
MSDGKTSAPQARQGALAWFAMNPVAANLLMAAIVVIGLAVASKIRQEVYPMFAVDEVNIKVSYRGASPDEVERSILLPIESEIRGMGIIHKISAVASEGNASVRVELVPGTDRNRGLQEITAAVQRISVFPDETEPPVISLGNGRRREVMRIAIYGDLSIRGLIDFARQLEEGLLADPAISLVDFAGVRDPEVHIEIPQRRLRSLGLTLEDVAKTIRTAAVDVPAGTIQTPGGDILLKTTERRDFAGEFADLPVVNAADGSKLLLSEIAEISDTFEDSKSEAYFDGKRAVFLSVFSSETQSPLDVATAVRSFIERERRSLPETIGLALSRDRSQDYQERLSLLVRNGTFGLILVLLSLGFFLELRVAFWTAIGIPISIIGSLAILPLLGSSINMLSLFGFIITLGIVVDDAVIVGEDIFHKISLGMSRAEAAVAGVKEMFVPVMFAVSTNIIAFLPLLFVPGESGRFFQVLPSVVIAVFSVSLIECLFILPAHLAHAGQNGSGWIARFDRRQTQLRLRLDAAITRFYSPLLRLAVENRYVTTAIFTVGLALVIVYLESGRANFTFRPNIETDFIQAEIEMPSGTPVARIREVAFQIEAAARRAVEKTGEKDILLGVNTTVAERNANEGEVSAILVVQSKRKVTGSEFAVLWRDEIGQIPDIDSLFFDYLFGPGGSAEIDIQLAHPDIETLRAAATEVAAAIDQFPGVEDIRKGFGRAMPQYNFEIKPAGRSLGITAQELGSQIRSAFYGAEALRQPRGRDELRVMVKLPESERKTINGLEELLIRAPNGGEIPLGQAAKIIPTTAPVRIERVDGGRVVNVTANVVPGVGNGNKILAAFEQRDMARIIARHPGLHMSFEGEQRDQREALSDLSIGLIASLFAIFAIIAALLRSYVQSVIILLTIPWSLAGAVLGHVAMGFDLSVFSIFGMIALCGMVVNGAFVLAVTRNDLIRDGHPPAEATILAAHRRFRPIFLTAVTTSLGLGPMIFETSVQALFLVPMAISLGVGTLASAIVILFLIPSLTQIVDDVQSRS